MLASLFRALTFESLKPAWHVASSNYKSMKLEKLQLAQAFCLSKTPECASQGSTDDDKLLCT
eukprot:961372-Amphidinium_carterae.1